MAMFKFWLRKVTETLSVAYLIMVGYFILCYVSTIFTHWVWTSDWRWKELVWNWNKLLWAPLLFIPGIIYLVSFGVFLMLGIWDIFKRPRSKLTFFVTVLNFLVIVVWTWIVVSTIRNNT